MDYEDEIGQAQLAHKGHRARRAKQEPQGRKDHKARQEVTEVTADTGRAFYAIKLMDATGTVLKSEERGLAEIRA